MSEPRTAAGDALLTDLIQDHEAPSYHVIERVRRGILSIEAEARTLAAEPEQTDEYRDRYEAAFRDHILGGPEDHVCTDLCSDAILDRLAGLVPRSNEYPPPAEPEYLTDIAEARRAELASQRRNAGLDVKRLRERLVAERAAAADNTALMNPERDYWIGVKDGYGRAIEAMDAAEPKKAGFR